MNIVNADIPINGPNFFYRSTTTLVPCLLITRVGCGAPEVS